jgi:putative DNA primase/helicase
MDRSIVVNLRRKKPEEAVEMLPANIDELHIDLRRKIIRWCLDVRDKLAANIHRPDNVGNDRAADNWTALFTVAGLINPLWLDRCQQAYRGLTRADEPELPALLLADIKQIVGGLSSDRIKTSDLLSELLNDPEKPWCNINGKGRMTAKLLAGMLKPFSIVSKSIRFGPGKNDTHRGYYVEQFKDAFERYVIHQEPIKPYI